MQPVIEQAMHALQLRRFEGAKTLVSAALAEAALPATRLPLLEVLAQAQAGLQEHEAAARSWHEAYQHAVAPDDKARLFEQARQALRDQEDHAALLQLAQEHLVHVRSPQEQAACLLAAGEALVHLQRYPEARQQYLEPALALSAATSETRLHLWHYLGLSHLAEHRLPDAAAAFRQSADLALGQHFASTAAHLTAQRTQLHHLRNAARFYEGVIHLMYQRPQQTVQSFQELQRPLTTVGASNMALFLGLAYRALQQPEAAMRSLQALARPATCPEPLRGPAAVVRMGIANIQEAPATVGEHLEAALEAVLQPRTSWEPSWQALLARELGLVFHRLGCREAAIVCYEDGLKMVLQRSGVWEEARLSTALQGADLLMALARLPLETWSVLARGELVQLLQGLAWLYDQSQTSGLADLALSLALRLAATPEQTVALWCQRAWQMVTVAAVSAPTGAATGTSRPDALAGLQQAQVGCTDATLARVVRGLIALLQGDEATASAAWLQDPALPEVPEMPELQAVCVAGWLWAHARQDSLGPALAQVASSAVLPWSTTTVLATALESLLTWTTHAAPQEDALPWLTTLLVQQPTPTLEALRLLCRPGYLPAPQHTVLLTALARVGADVDQVELADQVATLLGSPALMERVGTLVAEIDQLLATPAHRQMPPQAARQRKPRQRRATTPADRLAAATAHVLQLIGLLHDMSQSAVLQTTESSVPEVICGWLRRYTALSTHAPEVVGALLGLLRQCPGAAAVIPVILQQVTLSRRQRLALETALHAPLETTATTQSLLAWDDLHLWPVGRLLGTLADLHRPAGPGLDAALVARRWYIVALVLARLGLQARAIACLQTGIQQQPAYPRLHYALAHLLSAQDQPEVALQQLLQAWQQLAAPETPPQLLHLETLNALLALLEATGQYERCPEWIGAVTHYRAILQQMALSPAHQERMREIAGELALRQASYLAVPTPSSAEEAAGTAAQQLAWLEDAVALSPPPIRQMALHRQAETLARQYRYEAAIAIYNDLVQQWPDDQRAHQRLNLLTVLQQPRPDPARLDRMCDEALTAVLAGLKTPPPPSPATPPGLLAWLQEAPRHAPYVLEVIDLLTVHGAAAVQRQEWQRALEVLTPLYAMSAQPRQAYYLATVYYERSQATDTPALQDNETALRYVRDALTSAPAMGAATRLLQQLEAQAQTLLTARQQEQVRTAYRQRVCSFFEQHGVRVQEHIVDRSADTPWVELREVADLDETSGKLVTVVHVCFNSQANGAAIWPDETEVALYAQHQRDKQRLVEAHGIEALPWPHTAYEGETDFATLFPERLALNRDVLFVAFADLHALLRYAKVLQYIVQSFSTTRTVGGEPPSVSSLAATARYLTLMPLLRQRLHTLATATPSKVIQRQLSSVADSLTGEASPEHFQHLPAFVDAYAYFSTIVETMRAHLDTPPAERPSPQQEERQPPRPARRKRRQVKDRWREGEPERRSEDFYSDVS